MFQPEQSQFVCSSVELVSDGKGRPQPRKLILTSTHLVLQKSSETSNDADSNRPTHGSVSDRGLSGEGSFDSFVDTDTPPPEFNKREVNLQRSDGNFGLSVRGGAEHQLPLIISRLTPGTPAALSKQIYIGDAIIAINGLKITKLDHDEAVEFLNQSGPTVTLKLKYIPTAKTFLSPTHNNNLVESNLTEWVEEEEQTWETEKSLPLLFALLSRFLDGTDILRCNAFEVRDSTGNSSTGVIHCADAFSLTSWTKNISDIIIGLNNVQMKLWSQETQNEIYYVGWVWEGETDKSANAQELIDITQPAWLCWKPKILAIRGDNLYYMDYPPGVGNDWDCTEVMKYSVITSLLRVLTSASEHLDERQHCFTLQIAEEQSTFPPTRQQPCIFYLSTETRQELIKVESAWTKAVTAAVKTVKKCQFSVWWNKRPCQLELDLTTSSFNLYRSSSKPSEPLWSKPFSGLKGSSDDSRTRLTLKFQSENSETMECRDLHRILFTIHSFLLAKVVR